jgi:hypothetical protein
MVAVRATDRTVRASARSKEGEAGGPARLLRIIGKLFAEPQTLKSLDFGEREARVTFSAEGSTNAGKLC